MCFEYVMFFYYVHKIKVTLLESRKQDERLKNAQGEKEGYFKRLIKCSQYFRLNLHVSKVIYASLVVCALFGRYR